jgi:hypothetical protein
MQIEMFDRGAPRLVALYSPAPQSGKSTVARYLKRNGYVRVAFAEPLKKMLETLAQECGLSFADRYEGLYGSNKHGVFPPCLGDKTIADEPVTWRYLMQTLGTDWARNSVFSDFWIRIAEARIRKELEAGNSVIIDDMRFPNEYELITGLGGEVWEVRRRAAEAGYVRQHRSEGLMDNFKFDQTLFNETTIPELHSTIRDILDRG